MTVISTVDGDLSHKDIVDEITRFLAHDDVYSEAFASSIVVQVPTGITPEVPTGLITNEQDGLKSAYLHFSIANSTETLLPSGPYFVHDDGIYEAWRLYPDELDAFEIAVVPEATESARTYG